MPRKNEIYERPMNFYAEWIYTIDFLSLHSCSSVLLCGSLLMVLLCSLFFPVFLLFFYYFFIYFTTTTFLVMSSRQRQKVSECERNSSLRTLTDKTMFKLIHAFNINIQYQHRKRSFSFFLSGFDATVCACACVYVYADETNQRHSAVLKTRCTDPQNWQNTPLHVWLAPLCNFTSIYVTSTIDIALPLPQNYMAI